MKKYSSDVTKKCIKAIFYLAPIKFDAELKEKHKDINVTDSIPINHYQFYYNQFEVEQAYFRIESIFFRMTIKQYYSKVQEIADFKLYFYKIYALDNHVMFKNIVDFQFIDKNRRFGFIYFKGLNKPSHLHFEFFHLDDSKYTIKNLKTLQSDGMANNYTNGLATFQNYQFYYN